MGNHTVDCDGCGEDLRANACTCKKVYPYMKCPRNSKQMDPLEGCSACGGVGWHQSVKNPEFRPEELTREVEENFIKTAPAFRLDKRCFVYCGPDRCDCVNGIRAGDQIIFGGSRGGGKSRLNEFVAELKKQSEIDMGRRTPDGFMPTTPPRIVCAAIRRRTDGSIITGARHFDSIMQQSLCRFQKNDEGTSLSEAFDASWRDADQGFIDQWGRFYDRKEALQLAQQNEQCYRNPDAGHTLYSEDLY